MINFKMYSWCYSAGIVSYWYLHCTWKYKTYGNPVYIAMIKKMFNLKIYTCFQVQV